MVWKSKAQRRDRKFICNILRMNDGTKGRRKQMVGMNERKKEKSTEKDEGWIHS